ncbi:hypothetical protein GGX14DRAFT_453226 [Mycena pura]|uniref:F-box domain-containing protein n=1 Tax=Mycena pura TaxID=153505 RepID=A0AAD6VGK2_9AGAR|nr:hypothetical protein GGX14DRAFT_453226 [Mycena pura]
MASRLAKWALSRARMGAPHPSPRSDPQLALSSLPNELLLEMLEMMDDISLHLMAAASKRFYFLATQALLSRYAISLSSRSITATSSDALRALRIAMAFRVAHLKSFKFRYIVPATKPKSKDIRRIDALLRRFWTRPVRIRKVSLDFGNNIIRRPVGWTIGGLAPRLLSTCCGDSHTALFVVDNGLFTCRAKSLLMWSPYTREQYVRMQMHDGSRQWVPSIRSLHSLDITYPVCTEVSPHHPWTMVVVNMEDVTTLLLSIQLTAAEWSAVLSVISLPKLRNIGIWAQNIAFEASTAFLSRHTIVTLIYMSPHAARHPGTDALLCLPHLQRLTALAHYVVYLFSGCAPVALFPALTYVELWPDTQLPAALHLLSTHVPLTSLAFWLLSEDMDPAPAAWPVFPAVELLVLNKHSSPVACVSALLARAFPALRRLDVNGSFPKAGSPAEAAAISERKRALVSRIAQENPNINLYSVDRQFFLQ